MKNKKWLIVVSGVVLLLVAGGGFFLVRPDVWQQMVGNAAAGADAQAIFASGFIEAEEVNVAPEVGGRIVALEVAEGDVVAAGQVLARLDDTLVQAQVDIARAGLEVAEATLAQVQAGARPEQLRQAEAALAQAEAARDGAYQACLDLQALIDNPQDLDAQIALAAAQRDEAAAALEQAAAMRDAATLANDAFTDAVAEYPPGETLRVHVADGSLADLLPGLPPELVDYIPDLPDGSYTYENWEITISGGRVSLDTVREIAYPLGAHSIPTNYWRAWVGFNTAQAAYDGANQALGLLYEMRGNPQALAAQLDATEAQLRAAEALVALAQAQADGLAAGATAEEVAVVAAQVQQAQAQLDSALVVLGKLTLDAPAGGWVLDTVGHVGELAVPGVPLVTLADLDTVRLTVYVPENRLGQVQIGQRVEVQVDSFPGRVFPGRVAAIASEAEFTPRNVQTQEERVNMVFAVEVTIANLDYALKPGMPADAAIVAVGTEVEE
ncbi:MAG: efflux RND transporter periplasmic adaptor subunit [Anaerolineae bacterium]|nr:efflux RND transporter periplasmic adaptor subunit [Anaerolineae bacterium]